ncbi:MAG: DoxX family protein [Rhodobacteraceae bacterium]|nr:DoxX family protein [Paracoccaceae bacterium]MBL4874204.1 DoxX family protein [Paracoccaceae bacterium]
MNSKMKIYGLWVLKTLAALAFLGAAYAKLTGVEMMVATFDGIGIGQWFRYVTGVIEIVGAVLLFVPGKAFYGASLLAVTMFGAIASHLVLIGGNPLPAIILLAITATIAWNNKEQMSTAA